MNYSLDQSSLSSKNGYMAHKLNPVRKDSTDSQHNESIEGAESRKRTTQSLLEYLHTKNKKQFLGVKRQAPPSTAPSGESHSEEV